MWEPLITVSAVFIGKFSHHFLLHSSSCCLNVLNLGRDRLPTSSVTTLPSSDVLAICSLFLPPSLYLLSIPSSFHPSLIRLSIPFFLPSFLSRSLCPCVPFLLPPFHRDSIIQASALNNQVVLSQGGSHHADLRKYSLATSSQVTFIPPTHTNPALNGGVGVEGDYMNPFPEGLLHTYSNEGDLLQQVSIGRGREESREQP